MPVESTTNSNAYLWGTGIMTAGQLYGGIWGNRARAREAEKQRAFNLMMWNRQNQYNLPKNQMQRFRDAGLNPNLIYGNATDANAGPIQGYQQPDVQEPISDTVETLVKGLMLYNETRLANQQISSEQTIQNLNEAKINSELANQVLTGLKSEATKAETRNMLATYDNILREGKRILSDTEMKNMETLVKKTSIDLMNQDFQRKKLELSYANEYLFNTNLKMKLENERLSQEINQINPLLLQKMVNEIQSGYQDIEYKGTQNKLSKMDLGAAMRYEGTLFGPSDKGAIPYITKGMNQLGKWIYKTTSFTKNGKTYHLFQ